MRRWSVPEGNIGRVFKSRRIPQPKGNIMSSIVIKTRTWNDDPLIPNRKQSRMAHFNQDDLLSDDTTNCSQRGSDVRPHPLKDGAQYHCRTQIPPCNSERSFTRSITLDQCSPRFEKRGRGLCCHDRYKCNVVREPLGGWK